MTDLSFSPVDRLDGHVAVITGGVGAIGSATARRLARLGAQVVTLQPSQPSKEAELLASLEGKGHFAIEASVTDSASLAVAAQLVAQTTAGVSILVNCAGWTTHVPAADLDGLTDTIIDEMFGCHWRGSFAAIRAFAAQLKSRGDSVIVNMSSIAGMSGIGSNLAYAAAKAGVDAMTKALAKTLAPEIRVMAVAPGVVDTTFVPGRDANFNDRVGATLPLKRVGSADDVAAAIVACCTSLRYATGTILVADGGRHLG